MADGQAGLTLVNDIISLLKKWDSSVGGTKPRRFDAEWERKTEGFVLNAVDTIRVQLDTENMEVFSLMKTGTSYDWLHDVSIHVDIYTNKSSKRLEQMTNEVVRQIKNNTRFSINGNQYVQLLPSGIHNRNDQYRNVFRNILDCDVLRFNP